MGILDTIFVVSWNTDWAASILSVFQELGLNVDYEGEDGRRAYQRIRTLRPSVVIIDLSRKPSHGIEVGKSLTGVKALKDTSVWFTGSMESQCDLQQKFAGALFVPSNKILDHINKRNG